MAGGAAEEAEGVVVSVEPVVVVAAEVEEEVAVVVEVEVEERLGLARSEHVR